MTIEGTYVEDVLKSLLQQKLTFFIKNRTFKRGKLILFSQNNYHLELLLELDDGRHKRFEIPVPYNIEVWEEDNLVYFDYRLLTLARNNQKLYNTLKQIDHTGKSKFYDMILEIEIANTKIEE